MFHSGVWLSCLALVAMVTVSRGQKYAEWAFQEYLDVDFDLVCNDSTAVLQPGDQLEWYTPKGMRIPGNVALDNDKYTVDTSELVRGMTLKIKKITLEDSGVYLCFIYRNNLFHTKLNRGLNMFEPKSRDLLDKYRYNIMIGGIAAAVLFVPMVMICATYKWRSKTEEQREKKRLAREHAKKARRMQYVLSDAEAGQLPAKSVPENGGGYANKGFAESTNL